jgi:hypothetical protein
MFSNIGDFLNNENFIHGDAEGAVKWIVGEIEAFDEVLTGQETSAPRGGGARRNIAA